MAKRRLGLLAPIPAEDEKDLMLKEYHQSWRKTWSRGKDGDYIKVLPIAIKL
jgi:hypothetical protein